MSRGMRGGQYEQEVWFTCPCGNKICFPLPKAIPMGCSGENQSCGCRCGRTYKLSWSVEEEREQ